MASKSNAATSRPKDAAAIQQRVDSWVNTVTGLGTSSDKLVAGTVAATRDQWRNTEVLDTLYYEDDLIRKFVDKIVNHSLRQGVTPVLQPSLDDEVNDEEENADEVKRRAKAIERRFRELKVVRELNKADKRGRLHGGAALLIVSEGTSLETPLDLANIGRIRRLALIERDELNPATWYSDPLEPDYGLVETWRLMPTGTPSGSKPLRNPIIHTSRLLKFEGLEATRKERLRQNGWSPSIIIGAIEQLRDGQQNWRSIGLILNQAHQAVFKMEGLIEMVADGEEEVLQARMRTANMSRSVARAVLVDAEKESFEYHNASLSGLDVLAEKTWQRIAAAFEMPLTVLMGTSPAGLNATGESDMRQWYDDVQAHRTDVLGPLLELLVQLVAAELGDPSPSEWTISWPSLWQMSPTEEATYRKTIADTDTAYVNAQVVSAAEVAATRFGGGSYSAEAIQLDTEVRDLAAGAHDPEAAAAAYPKPKPDVSSDDTSKPADPVVDPELAKDPAAALNGAQVKSLQEIVMSVARRELPRESGIAMMLAAFPIEPAQADAIMGAVGRTFFAEAPAAGPVAGGQ